MRTEQTQMLISSHEQMCEHTRSHSPLSLLKILGGVFLIIIYVI